MIKPGQMLLFAFLFVFINDANSQDKKSIRILFVGNSLTYVNDLPALLKEIAIKDSNVINYHSILLPNYSLEDHWNDGNAQKEIEKGVYDFAVLQQGPSALPQSQLELLLSAKKFAAVCAANNCKMVLYMVWPSKERLFDLDNVVQSYKNAAKETGAILCPAGFAWKYAWQSNEKIALYGEDNFHPSVKGSILAALVIYAELFQKNNFNFLNRNDFSWKKEITKKELETLKIAAFKSLKHNN